MTSIYQALAAAGCELDHHESDLYVRDTEQARAVLAKFPEHSPKPFVSQIKDTLRSGQAEWQLEAVWLEIPFAYDPYWMHKVLDVLEPHLKA